jgi:hypothetical protein
MNRWYIVFTTTAREATNGRSHHHFTIPDTGPAFGVSAAVTHAGRVAYA